MGWYGYREGEFFPTGALGNLSETTIELYLWSLNPAGREAHPSESARPALGAGLDRVPAGKPADLPARSVAAGAAGRRADRRTHEQEASGYGASPVAFESLANLTLGAANLYGSGDVLRSQVRYFDPDRRRAGLAEDVAALVEKIEPDSVTLTLVNTSAAGVAPADRADGCVRRASGDVRPSGRSNDPAERVALRSAARRRCGRHTRHWHQTTGQRSNASFSVGAVVCCGGHDDRQAADARRLRQALARGVPALSVGQGLCVHAFDGGADALEFARSSNPDLVVLDLGLPDVDGWEVARRLKGDAHTKDIPIIAFSGRSMQHEQMSALRAGCDVYAMKPCAPDRLLGAIRSCSVSPRRQTDRRSRRHKSRSLLASCGAERRQ